MSATPTAQDRTYFDPASGDRGRQRRIVLIAFAVVALLVLLDQWSKAAVFAWITPDLATLELDVHGHPRQRIHGEWLAFMLSCNPGAAFGQFTGSPTLLVGLRIVAVFFLAWLLWRADPRHRTVFVAMVLVLAGALGNVIDNLWTGCVPAGGDGVRPYGVRDFISVWFEPLFSWDVHFPSFNVADSCISVGAVLWVVSGLFRPRVEPEPDSRAESAGAE